MSSSGDAIVAPDCESRWASRDDALVRGRAGAPRLGPARAARSSRELFRFSLCWILALLAASRRLAPIASIESVFLMTQASARVAGYPLEGREIICVFAGFFLQVGRELRAERSSTRGVASPCTGSVSSRKRTRASGM
mmetsp:Transcript_1478/g.4363  ORF Transcript_1478/g.4363 Transcript_1478/m.4363 type:complete len:138 (+) Transcript_1478:1827-2240(+)